MAAQQVIDYSGKRLKVDTIEVINNIEGQQIAEIQTNVASMQTLQAALGAQTTDYWSSLSDDNKITPAEKKTLYKEWQTIQQTYTGLEAEAVLRGKADLAHWNTYETYYAALNGLLNTNLKVFNDMKSTTKITDREAFNAAFKYYYEYENYCQMDLADKVTQDYWSKLSEDQFISPVEKKVIKQQVNQIDVNYNALYTKVQQEQFTSRDWWNDYVEVYTIFKNYINNTIHLFDNMEATTELASRETFNEMFDMYYSSEQLTRMSLDMDIVGDIGYRVLDDLEEEGVDNEIGLYHGKVYQYVATANGGTWIAAGTEGFVGTLLELPTSETENTYFLVGTDGTSGYTGFSASMPLQVKIKSGSKTVYRELLINGNSVNVNTFFEKGFIYVMEDNVWKKLTDKNDYRYFNIMMQQYAVTGELPEVFQSKIAEITTAEVDKKVTQKNTTYYLGPYSSEPGAAEQIEGCWFLWTGKTSESFVKGHVYERKDNAWKERNSTDPTAMTMYVTALNDILDAQEELNDGYFSTIFCRALFSNIAFIKLIRTMSLILEEEGYIQSKNWQEGSDGFRMGSDGHAEFNDVVVRGRVEANEGYFKGNITGASGTFSGDITGATGSFKGDISSATGIFKDRVQTPSITIGNLKPGSSWLSSWEEGKYVIVYSKNGTERSNTYILFKGSGTVRFKTTITIYGPDTYTKPLAHYKVQVSVIINGTIRKKSNYFEKTVGYNDYVQDVQSVDLAVNYNDRLQIEVEAIRDTSQSNYGIGNVSARLDIGTLYDSSFLALITPVKSN